MIQAYRESVRMFAYITATLVLSLTMLISSSTCVRADAEDAKKILKSMSEYIASQKAISFGFDATLEIVTTDNQKLGLASSGTLNINRPDNIHLTRTGALADIELFFDGKTLTLLGKNLNKFTQLEVPGSVDHLIDELKDTYNRPLPAADILLTNSYDEMMRDVVDVKDLGRGVVDGVRCDHLAFRTDDVDWQIWIAEGPKPYPYRYVITSKLIDGGPQYTVQFRNWQTGGEVVADEYTFNNKSKAEKVEFKDIKGADDLPDNFMKGEPK